MKPTTRARLHNSARSVLMSNYTRSRHMTAKTDLPPLPERFDCTNGSAQWCYGCYTMTRDDLGDYVLAEDYDALRNASEALQAEAEALLAEVAEWKRVAAARSEAEDENERLRAEVREAREFRDKLVKAIGNEQLRAFIEKYGEPVPLTNRVQAAEARAERLADALEEIRSRSAMNLAMHPNPFELTARLGDIYQIADAVLSQEGK